MPQHLPALPPVLLTSMQNSPVSGSLTTVAVRPAAELDFPEVYTARGRKLATYLCTATMTATTTAKATHVLDTLH